MNRNLRFGVGAAVIVATIGYLMYVGVRETSSYYLTIQEFAPKKDSYQNMPLRVAGRVKPGSVEYDPRTLRLRFALADFTAPAAPAGDSVPVDFTGIKPDMFADGRDVIVEGKYAGGVLQANQVLTSCPSKYEAKTAEADAAPPKGAS